MVTELCQCCASQVNYREGLNEDGSGEYVELLDVGGRFGVNSV